MLNTGLLFAACVLSATQPKYNPDEHDEFLKKYRNNPAITITTWTIGLWDEDSITPLLEKLITLKDKRCLPKMETINLSYKTDETIEPEVKQLRVAFEKYHEVGNHLDVLAGVAECSSQRKRAAFYKRLAEAYKDYEDSGFLLKINIEESVDAGVERTMFGYKTSLLKDPVIIPQLTGIYNSSDVESIAASNLPFLRRTIQKKDDGKLSNLLGLASLLLGLEYANRDQDKYLHFYFEQAATLAFNKDHDFVFTNEQAVETGNWQTSDKAKENHEGDVSYRYNSLKSTKKSLFNFLLQYVQNGAEPVGDFTALITGLEQFAQSGSESPKSRSPARSRSRSRSPSKRSTSRTASASPSRRSTSTTASASPSRRPTSRTPSASPSRRSALRTGSASPSKKSGQSPIPRDH